MFWQPRVVAPGLLLSTLLLPLGTPGLAVEPTAEIPAAEKVALEALYIATNGSGWTDHSAWMTGADPRTWHGIGCGSRKWPQLHVTVLQLGNDNLVGALPW